jgi:hypothetical protein
MPTVHFSGRVLPSSNSISMDQLPKPRLLMNECGLEMVASISVRNSLITVGCELNRYVESELAHIHKFCFDMARACVDLVAFAGGYGVVVVFETFTDESGAVRQLHYVDPMLEAECTVIKINAPLESERRDFHTVLSLVMTDFPLMMALNDLIQANSLPHQGPTNCGRVLDSLRKLVAPGPDKRRGWATLREIVRVDEAYTKWVSDHSTTTRHGGGTYIPGNETREISRRTWVVMNRFLEYRKRGNQPLPSADFPFLLG